MILITRQEGRFYLFLKAHNFWSKNFRMFFSYLFQSVRQLYINNCHLKFNRLFYTFNRLFFF